MRIAFLGRDFSQDHLKFRLSLDDDENVWALVT